MFTASSRVVVRLSGATRNLFHRLIDRPARLAIAVLAFAALLITTRAQAQYSFSNTGIVPDGQFTASNGSLYYWNGGTGFHIYNVASGITTTIGLPPKRTQTNGFGDPFGVFDAENNIFYAATYESAYSSYIYAYDVSKSTWLTPGPAGVSIINAYGGQVYNSQLYVSGLAEPWSGGYGQDTYIFAVDHLAITTGVTPRHDTLIRTAGNSANIAIAPNGDVYYGSFSTKLLYRWSAAQVASVTNDLYAGDEDSFLTLQDAQKTWAMPGDGNGLAVDAAGHVFFAVNGYDEDFNASRILGMLDDTEAMGYRVIYETGDDMDWFGPISIDGDFLAGDPLYLSPSTYGGSGIIEITYTGAVPEPSSILLAASGLLSLAFARRMRSKK